MEQVMLDMIPTGAKAVCHVSQYDIGRTIRFNLRSGGAVYTLAGTETVKVYIKKPDGTTAERNIANTSSTYVDWVTGEGDCDQAGKCECELVITSGTTVIGSKNFTVKIEEDPYNEQGVVTETAGPAVIATFTTNVVDLLQEVKCNINPIQNGTPWIDSNEINKEPYIKRAVAGMASRIGNHLYNKLVGGTVAFNQLVKWETGTSNGLRATMDTDGVVSISGTSTGGYANITSAVEPNDNHVYIFGRTIVANPNNIAFYWGLLNSNQTVPPSTTKSTGDSWVISKVNSHTGPSTGVAGFEVGTDFTGVKCKIIAIDLTAMFGSTIADYIYNLEFSTTGAGVAWFRALFPNDYYAYNAGELMSVKATAHIMRDASNTVIGNYPLDSNLELRGIPKLVNNKLEYDGDEYTSDGNVLRKYGIVDMGTLNWRVINGGADASKKRMQTTDLNGIAYNSGSNQMSPLVCKKYIAQRPNDSYFNSVPYGIAVAEVGALYVNDPDYESATSPDDFKASLSGVYLVYEKVTPSTEQATPFTNPQVCDENGTEEYTDNRAVAIPVGHETYQANICPIIGFDELNIKQSGQDTSEIAKLIRLEFDDTVYLAEVSCLNGVWKLKLLGAEVNLGDLSWYPGACALENKYTMRSDGIANVVLAPPSSSIIVDILCSIYPTNSGDTTFLGNTGISIMRGGTLAVFDDRYSTIDSANAFKSAMTGVKLVYPLATPTEITLDETEQFESLIGVNNVWHDGNGDTEVKYLYNA